MAPNEAKPRAGVLGGSFDPIHFGHLLIAWEVIASGFCDTIILVPCGDNRVDKQLAASGSHRLEMTKLGVHSFLETMNFQFEAAQIEVDATEVDRGIYVPTHSLLKLLETKYPNNELWLIIGSDLIADIKNWYDISPFVFRCNVIPGTGGRHLQTRHGSL